MAARSPYQRSLLLPIPVSRPSYLCALRNLRRQVLDLCSQRSNIRSLTVTSLLVGRQSGVAPTLVCASENGFFHELHNETIFLTSMNGFPAICSAT